MKLVLDAGPIIALAKVGALHLLPELFEEILVPGVVMQEVGPRGEKRRGAEIRRQPWARVVRVAPGRIVELEDTFDIDPGEAAAICVAEDAPTTSVVLMDDRAGLAAARARGLVVLRTGALLVRAVDDRLLTHDDLAVALTKLCAENYLSEAAVHDILALAKSRRR